MSVCYYYYCIIGRIFGVVSVLMKLWAQIDTNGIPFSVYVSQLVGFRW